MKDDEVQLSMIWLMIHLATIIVSVVIIFCALGLLWDNPTPILLVSLLPILVGYWIYEDIKELKRVK